MTVHVVIEWWDHAVENCGLTSLPYNAKKYINKIRHKNTLICCQSFENKLLLNLSLIFSQALVSFVDQCVV